MSSIKNIGLITSGGGRDLLQVRQLDYPVFTASTICAHAYCHILHIGLPVRVGGLAGLFGGWKSALKKHAADRVISSLRDELS